jgi:agmatinase
MPLRTAPLPRMAGHLSFMRSVRANVEDLSSGTLAVIGVPMEGSKNLKSGARFSPLSIRETSVYFGWYANPQFSNPINIDEQEVFDTSSLNERLFDLGDIPILGQTRSKAEELINHSIAQVYNRNATSIVLGGDSTIIAPVSRGIANGNSVAYIQIGGKTPGTSNTKLDHHSSLALDSLLASGEVKLADTTILAPAENPTVEFLQELSGAGAKIFSSRQLKDMSSKEIADLSLTLSNRELPVIVNLDLSSVSSELHGMSDRPIFNGMSLKLLRRVLVALASAPIATLIVTGHNPTINGLSIVKTGQRLIVTALVGYICSRLGYFNESNSNDN